ncbi:hypothetical protein EDD28_0416 [Salana multivorans]|uniref:Uncharacterized protein n=1 Tax=Salana multivorans TaxID=120377 RepID=A0A3N2D7T7_9MICO|nr:hypothetical protein [Salana multivorans]ROR95853.1 hypothetical protein EDD28_0416 [Salana multivorans]
MAHEPSFSSQAHPVLVRAFVLLVSLVLAAVVVPAALVPASAASPVLDTYISVTSVKVNGNRSITVAFNVKRDIPSQVGITVSWKYANASRSNASHGLTSITGKAGPRTVTLSPPPASPMLVRVVFALARPSESLERHVLIDPGMRTTTTVVSPGLAAANAVAQHIPGAILTFAPQGRAVRFVGALVLGWSVFSDVRTTLTGRTNACPKMEKGQVVQTTTWVTSAGGLGAQYNVRTKVWKDAVSRDRGVRPLCDVSYVAASWS